MDIRMEVSNHIILKVVGGSVSYGIETPNSDLDLKGIFVPPKDFIIGIQNVNTIEYKPDSRDLDTLKFGIERTDFIKYAINGVEGTFYALPFYIQLAIDANPNILELLFAANQFYIWDGISRQNKKIAQKLIQHRDLFLSRKARHTYSGYAHAQLKRIKGHKKHLDEGPVNEPIICNYIKFYDLSGDQISPLELKSKSLGICRFVLPNRGLSKKDTNHSVIKELGFRPIPGAHKEVFWVHEHGVGIADQQGHMFTDFTYRHYDPISKVIGIATFAKKQWKEDWDYYQRYQIWINNRNRKRFELESKFGFDTKHACHLVRLLISGKELLQEGTLTVYRERDNQLLRDVRDGKYSYEWLINFAEEIDNEMETLYNSNECPLPKKPRRKQIDDLLRDILETKLKMENKKHFFQW